VSRLTIDKECYISKMCVGLIMKTSHFLVILLLIFNSLAFNILPSPECTHARSIISVENMYDSGIAQISKEYFPASPYSTFVTSKSKSQIPSWQSHLSFELIQRIRQQVGYIPFEVFLPPSTTSKVVLATILRC
jgi:hypothetical protein